MNRNYNPVTHRNIGEYPNITPPVHVPSLLEEAKVIRCDKNGKPLERRRNADEWCRLMQGYIDNTLPYKWSQIASMADEYVPI